jgi:hypothetical protein
MVPMLLVPDYVATCSIEFKSQQLFWAINHATSNCIVCTEWYLSALAANCGCPTYRSLWKRIQTGTNDTGTLKRSGSYCFGPIEVFANYLFPAKVSDKASSGIPIPIPPAPDNPAPPAPIDPPTPAPIDQPTPAPVDPPAPVPAPAPAPAPADSATPAPAGIPTSGTVQAWIMAWDNGDITSKFVLNVSIPNEETGIPVLYTFNVNSDVALHRFKSQDAPQEKKLTASYTSLDQFLGYDRFNGSIGGGRIFIKTEKGVKVKGAIEGGPGDGQTFTGAGTWARS